MKTIILMIVLTSFLSCRTDRKIEFSSEQCQVVMVLDSYGDIAPDESFCRCRPYLISKEFIGSLGGVTRHPVYYCNEIMGYSVRNNTKLVNFMEDVRVEINENTAD